MLGDGESERTQSQVTGGLDEKEEVDESDVCLLASMKSTPRIGSWKHVQTLEHFYCISILAAFGLIYQVSYYTHWAFEPNVQKLTHPGMADNINTTLVFLSCWNPERERKRPVTLFGVSTQSLENTELSLIHNMYCNFGLEDIRHQMPISHWAKWKT